MEVRKDIEDDRANIYGVVNQAYRVSGLTNQLKIYQQEKLKNHSYESFTVKKELFKMPAVPVFRYKQLDMAEFIDKFGSFDSSEDL